MSKFLQKLVNSIFQIVYLALMNMAKLFKTTYNCINIIVYYGLIPLSWTIMIDFYGKTNGIACIFLLGFWCGIIIGTWGHFKAWCDTAFRKSVDFLLYFGRIGMNYTLSSVVICVLVPLVIYGILITLFATA